MLRFDNSRSRPRPLERRRPRQARSRQSVEAILDAAAQLFVQRGFAATTTNAIAERAGVSIGTLYQYFADKAAIVIELESRHVSDAESFLAASLHALHAKGLPIERWARELVRLIARVNDAPHDRNGRIHPDTNRVVYELTVGARGQDIGGVVEALARDVATALRSYRVPRAALRARTVVVAAIAGVHELVLTAPRGPKRQAAEREVTALVVRYLTGAR